MSRSHAAQKWFARLAVVGLAVVGVQVVGDAAASAHSNALSGVATCEADHSYTVTWTIVNDWTTSDAVSINSAGPSSSTLTPSTLLLTPTGNPGSSGEMVQTGIPAGTASATLDIKGYWADDNTTVASTSNSVDLTGVCPVLPPPADHAATAPTFGNGACVAGVVTQPSITIPSDRGVSYTLNSKSIGAGTIPVAAGTYLVEATSSVFTLTGATSWTLKPTAVAGNCATTVTPVAPSVSQSACSGSTPTLPTLTIATTPGIVYTVSSKAPYRAGQSVVVTATTLAGHILPRSLPNGWSAVSSTVARSTVTFADTASCTVAATVVKPGFTSAACTGSSDLTLGSYTVPSSKGVQYQVNGKPMAAGTYTVPWGSTISVVAVAKPGYTVAGRTAWQRTFPTQAHCAELAGQHSNRTPDSAGAGSTSDVPPTLASTGAPTGSLLVGGLGAILLGAMITLLASRRRGAEA